MTKKTYHSWIQVGEIQRSRYKYEGDPDRINYVCLNCESTKSELTTTPPKLNKYKAVSPTCSERAGFFNRKHYTTDDIMTRQKLNNLINKIDNERTRVLVKVLYLFLPRIQEAVQLKKKDFITKGDNFILNRYILKKKTLDGLPPKELTYMLIQDSFCKEIINYVKEVPGENDFVFPSVTKVFGYTQKILWDKHLSRNHCITLVKDATGFSPHFFRHLRISHLAPYCRTEFDLMRKTHHTTFSSLSKYVHLIPDSDNIPLG